MVLTNQSGSNAAWCWLYVNPLRCIPQWILVPNLVLLKIGVYHWHMDLSWFLMVYLYSLLGATILPNCLRPKTSVPDILMLKLEPAVSLTLRSHNILIFQMNKMHMKQTETLNSDYHHILNSARLEVFHRTNTQIISGWWNKSINLTSYSCRPSSITP
jgi:hypothetical protein